MQHTFDTIIIGNGAAAFSAAIRLSELSDGNERIAMVGSGPVGGTCLNRGCVPTKYLIEASRGIYASSHPAFSGIEPTTQSFNFSKLMEGLGEIVQAQRKQRYDSILDHYDNISFFPGSARFQSDCAIEISSDSSHGLSGVIDLKAEKVLIASGSSPSIPSINGLATVPYFTTDTLWKMDQLPECLTIFGAGPTGLEMAQAFRNMGVAVCVVEERSAIIARFEGEISGKLKETLESEGIRFYLESNVKHIRKEGRNAVIELAHKGGHDTITCDALLLATGRKPNTLDLNLSSAGVKTDRWGFIITDSRMLTSNPRIFAAGDCISKRLMLETLAAREGAIAAENMAGKFIEMDYSCVPAAVFTNPQAASVGMTESEAKELYGDALVTMVPLEMVPKALISGKSSGIIKLIAHPLNGRILGVHALAHNASEFIMEAALAIKCAMSYEDIIGTVHIFPTFAEGIKIAAQAFLRDVSRMSCCVE
ncbi:MAG: mercury(II) reductase [Methanomassiliicoccales archaeon]